VDKCATLQKITLLFKFFISSLELSIIKHYFSTLQRYRMLLKILVYFEELWIFFIIVSRVPGQEVDKENLERNCGKRL